MTRRRSTEVLAIGLFLILLGTAWLLNNMGYDVWEFLIKLWPVPLIAMGLDKILRYHFGS